MSKLRKFQKSFIHAYLHNFTEITIQKVETNIKVTESTEILPKINTIFFPFFAPKAGEVVSQF